MVIRKKKSIKPTYYFLHSNSSHLDYNYYGPWFECFCKECS